MRSSPLPLPRGSVWPDYRDGGLFGLMRTIGCWLGGGQAEDVSSATLPALRGPVVVFLLVDGLGDNFLLRFGAGSHLHAARRGRLTSVFPSTTASAVTTVLTGLAPASHGLTGWFIHDRRFGGVIAPLPMVRRGGGELRGFFRLQRLFPYRSLFQKARRPALFVSPAYIAHSPFSQRHGRGAEVLSYRGIGEMVEAIVHGVGSLRAAGGGYLHAYYSAFDAVSHVHGSTSTAAMEQFAKVDRAFHSLVERLAGSGCDLVVSADHGFIDAPDERCIALDRYPQAKAMLAAPLFGERRAAWCHVRRGAEREFEAFARQELAGKAVVRSSAQLASAGLLGPGKPHRRLRERIGTHALLMEAGWTVVDRMPGERLPAMIGVHGGLSPEEMWIPLIHTRC